MATSNDDLTGADGLIIAKAQPSAHHYPEVRMLTLLIIGLAVALLAIGIAAGWAMRGPTARWCGVCGGSLTCPVCLPVAIGRAQVRR